MAWYESGVLHVWAPDTKLYGENWVEQTLGEAVFPLFEERGGDVEWM